MLRNKEILITGAGGFIGSHLTEKLLKMDANIHAFVRYNSRSHFGFIEHFPTSLQNKIDIIQGNLNDEDAIQQAMKGIDIVFHLGAMIAIPYSYIHPRETIETNIIGTYNILNAAKEAKVKKIIHTSTSEVYGTAKYIPIDEIHPLQGQSPYSASKIASDAIALSYYYSFNLPIVIIRPFNTYGPRQSARAIIPTIISQALRGDDICIGSIYPTRDFTFVSDTIQAFIQSANSNKAIGEVINIGTGTEISIQNLVKKIIDIINPKLHIKIEDKRKRPLTSEVNRLLANTTKAKKILNWESSISLDEGLQLTIDWMTKNIDLYKTDRYII